MSQHIIPGSHVKVFINGSLFPEAQEVAWTIDRQEQETYGIDSMFPQEIAPIRSVTYGSIRGLRLKQSNGLQARSITPDIGSLLASPYVSIRIQDRITGEDIIFLPKSKISSEQYGVAAKTGFITMNLSFRSIQGLQPLDRM